MADWADVEEIALALPETAERPSHGMRSWRVRDKLFVWERPLRDREVEELGDAAPAGPILGARVEDMLAKQALIADEPALYFTTSHFDRTAAVLVRLALIGRADLEELIAEAWLTRAPKRLADEYLESLGRG
jgi:hypothetical protein